MIDGLWQLPGPARLLDEVLEALGAGRSAVIVRPQHVELGDLAGHVRARTDHDCVMVNCRELVSGGNLLQRVHAHLALSTVQEASLVTLAEALDGRVLWIEPHSREDARALSALISEMAVLRRRRQSGPLLCACVTIEQLLPLPTPDAGLAVLWWWGRLGPLDTRVVVDAAMSRRRVLGDLEAVAECSAFALGVADQLARGWTGSPQRDLRLVIAAQELLVDSTEVQRATELTGSPPSALHRAWDAGQVDWWGDHVAIHPACLLVDGAALERRVWRGHLQSVLPFVETRRQALAAWAAARHRQANSTKSPQEITDLECGPLLHYIRTEQHLKSSRTALALATALRDARNHLAHLRPLERQWLERHQQLLSTTSIF